MNDNTANPDAGACYAAFKAHDTRFDGRIFMGVSSTGIYCRPICRVKMPREENCSFHTSAAAAEAAGFRPCLKCRPELAPGNSPMDSIARLARQTTLAIEEEGVSESSLSELSKRLNVSGRHLRRAFAAEYGVSPVKYQQIRKLLLAKHLLTDTALSVTDAAFAAGFGSIRRFNDLFKKQYRLSPRDFRQESKAGQAKETDGVTLLLGYRPPYAWNELLSFLGSRAIPGVESVLDNSYRRTVTVLDGEAVLRGWICVRNLSGKNALALTLAPALLPALSKLLAKVRLLFDVNCDPIEVSERLVSLNERLGGALTPGLRLPGCFDSFEMAVRAVLGQQITVKAARTLAMRFAAEFGKTVTTPFAELTRVFPTYAEVTELEPPIEALFGPLGIIGARARSICVLAQALASGEIILTQRANPEKEMQKLLRLPGFGPWTVQYIAMRALAWPDAFPYTDYGVKKALEGLSPKEIIQMAENWRPWRSYATIALWNSLS